MSYYMGDFYGPQAGDPGFFSFLGGLAKRAVSFIPGVGPVASTAIQAVSRTAPMMRRVGGLARAGAGVIARHPAAAAITAAGTAAVVGRMAAARALPGAPAGMRGFHVSKHTGRLVKNRRMRVTNPRALRRAIRRANGFARLARRVLHFTSPRAPRGRAIFRHRRRAGARMKA